MGVNFMKVMEKSAILKLLKQKEYAKLLVANSISRFGDSIDAIAFSWMVYILTGSELLLGATFALNALPNLLFGAFTGVLADRFDKKKLIILSFLGRGIAVTIIGLLYFTGNLALWHIFALTVVNSTLEILMSPAVISMLPKLIDKDSYTSANSLSASIYKFTELIGTAIAGIIIAKLGITGALLIDAGTFFCAAGIIYLIKYAPEELEKVKLNVKSTFEDIKEGFSYLKLNKIVLISMILFAIINFCLSPISVLLPIFSNKILKGGPEVLSLISISLSVGTILGGLVVAHIGDKIQGYKLLIGAAFIFGLSYSFLYMPGNIIASRELSLIATAIGFGLMGLMIPAMTAPISTYVLVNTDKKVLGRVSGIMSLVSTGIIPLGAALTGVVAQYFSASLIFLIMGAIIILTSLGLLFNNNLKTA